ncbi:TonB-dependent receptor plug domain-containing protein [Candidatus Uabimicrobium sp. HlEnr_7]|uniref:TonB-dependent receptor plug domain-containing protein n=1 Tax=Candidatus Uabimicrobium helgolandensis TaxID=3095367 RepID=UPI00355847C2
MKTILLVTFLLMLPVCADDDIIFDEPLDLEEETSQKQKKPEFKIIPNNSMKRKMEAEKKEKKEKKEFKIIPNSNMKRKMAEEKEKENQEEDVVDEKWALDETVVTPNTQESKKFDQPNIIYKLDQETLQNRKMVRTLPEALKETPGVMVQKTAHGQGSPFIRGFTGFRTLLLIDGVRLNNSIFREGPNQYWNTVDFLAIKSLEVVKGPGSLIYGSDAVGGVVNAITRERERYSDDSLLNTRLYYRYSSGERSHVTRAEVSGNYGYDFGFTGGIFYKRFGDLIAGGDTNELEKTGYDERGGDFKLNWFLSNHEELVFGYFGLNQNNAERTHKTIFSKSFRGTDVGDELQRRLDHDRHLTYVQYRLYDVEEFVDNATFTASWHYQQEEQDRVRANLRRDVQGITTNTVGLNARLASDLGFGTLVYGGEYYRDFVRSFREDFNADGSFRGRRIQGPVGDDATYDLLGAYVQLELPVFDQLTIIPGVRYTHAWLEANEVEDPVTGDAVSIEDDWGGFVGSLKFVWALNENWHIFGGVSQSFRTPNLSDVTRFDTARSNEIETPVRELDPEYFISYEIGLKAQYSNWYFQGSYYYTQIDNMIIRFPTGNIINGDVEVTKDNEGDGFVHGVELEGGFNITSDWQVFGGFAWMEGIVSTFPEANGIKKDEPIDRMQPAQGFVGLRWTHPSKKYWAEGLVTMVRGQDRLSTRDAADTERIPPGGTPGYTTYTVRAGAQITDNITVSAAIENISDKDFRVHGSGQNEPGFNGIVSVDFNY